MIEERIRSWTEVGVTETVLYFDEYTHLEPSNGKVYHPYYVLIGPNKGKWLMEHYILTFTEMCELCDIPEDERLMLKLKYHGCSSQVTI